MSFGLMAGCLAGGVAVSNERGVFVPPHSVQEAFAATARAFAAIAAPPGQIQLEPYNALFGAPNTDGYRLPKILAARVLNPPPVGNPLANNFPGVFGGPTGGAASAPPAGTGNTGTTGDTAPNAPEQGATPPVGGTNGGGGGIPSIGGFTTPPTPVQDLGNIGTGTGTGTGTGGTGTIVTPPVDTGTNPPTTGTNPPTTGTNPPTTGTNPPTTGTNPPTTGTNPPTTGTNPPTTGDVPPIITLPPLVTPPPTTGPGGGTDVPVGGGGGPTGPGTGGGTTCAMTGTCPIDTPNPPTCADTGTCVGPPPPPPGAVPEPANWAMLLLGFGIVGGMQRMIARRRRTKLA